jgi:hypothetical protein
VGSQLPKHAALFPREALTLLTQPLHGQLAMVTLTRRIGIADTGARTVVAAAGPWRGNGRGAIEALKPEARLALARDGCALCEHGVQPGGVTGSM